MAVISAADTELHLSTTEAGTYTCLGQCLTIARREETADDERINVFCSDVALVEAGNDENTMDVTGFLDLTDAQQNSMRTARRNGTTVFLRSLWDGENGEQQEYQVISLNTEADRNGTGVNKYVRWTATFRSAGDLTTITAP